MTDPRAQASIDHAVAVDRACPTLWHYVGGALRLTPASDALCYRRWLATCALTDLRVVLADETRSARAVERNTDRLRRNTRALIDELRRYRSTS